MNMRINASLIQLQSQMLSNLVDKFCLMVAVGEMKVLKQMDSVSELFVVHDGEEICFWAVYFPPLSLMECDCNIAFKCQNERCLIFQTGKAIIIYLRMVFTSSTNNCGPVKQQFITQTLTSTLPIRNHKLGQWLAFCLWLLNMEAVLEISVFTVTTEWTSKLC